MSCEVCGRTPLEDGVTLWRQNPKGEKGVWRCTVCNKKPQDPEVEDIVNIIERGR